MASPEKTFLGIAVLTPILVTQENKLPYMVLPGEALVQNQSMLRFGAVEMEDDTHCVIFVASPDTNDNNEIETVRYKCRYEILLENIPGVALIPNKDTTSHLGNIAEFREKMYEANIRTLLLTGGSDLSEVYITQKLAEVYRKQGLDETAISIKLTDQGFLKHFAYSYTFSKPSPERDDVEGYLTEISEYREGLAADEIDGSFFLIDVCRGFQLRTFFHSTIPPVNIEDLTSDISLVDMHRKLRGEKSDPHGITHPLEKTLPEKILEKIGLPEKIFQESVSNHHQGVTIDTKFTKTIFSNNPEEPQQNLYELGETSWFLVAGYTGLAELMIKLGKDPDTGEIVVLGVSSQGHLEMGDSESAVLFRKWIQEKNAYHHTLHKRTFHRVKREDLINWLH